jgi:uncharacterized protein YciU (UPF0263 family)
MMMDSPTVSPAFDYFLDFIMDKKTPEEILAFRLPESEKERAIELLDKQDDDALTPEDTAELQQMIAVERILRALKARALKARV